MNREDLIAAVAALTDEPLGIVELIVDTTLRQIVDATVAGEVVALPDFGRFRVNTVEAQEKVTPAGVQYQAPAYLQIHFRPAHDWRKRLNAPDEQREAAE